MDFEITGKLLPTVTIPTVHMHFYKQSTDTFHAKFDISFVLYLSYCTWVALFLRYLAMALQVVFRLKFNGRWLALLASVYV